jgi:hypothetical protein
MKTDKFSALDLLDLPELERAIVLYLMRHESSATPGLYAAIHANTEEIHQALVNLTAQKRVIKRADGQYEVISGASCGAHHYRRSFGHPSSPARAHSLPRIFRYCELLCP